MVCVSDNFGCFFFWYIYENLLKVKVVVLDNYYGNFVVI